MSDNKEMREYFEAVLQDAESEIRKLDTEIARLREPISNKVVFSIVDAITKDYRNGLGFTVYAARIRAILEEGVSHE